MRKHFLLKNCFSVWVYSHSGLERVISRFDTCFTINLYLEKIHCVYIFAGTSKKEPSVLKFQTVSLNIQHTL